MGNLIHLYFVPSGRIKRATWWLNAVIVLPVLYFIAFFTAGFFAELYYNRRLDFDYAGRDAIYLSVVLVASVLMIWCEFVVGTKRFHDQDRSARWVLLNLLPFIGSFVWIGMLGFVSSHEGANRYGPGTQVRMLIPPPQAG